MNTLFSDQVLSVSDVTTLIKRTLEESFYDLHIEGEISNFRPASSGHWYFQLNDRDSAIQVVMFKQKSWRLSFTPKDGDRVTVTGNISVYAKRGSYQLICESMTKTGTGDILAILEERKRQLAAAGYFDADKKKTLPPFPKRVGVVTSPTGAALHDILQVLGRRNPAINVIILPATVQGDGAAETIAKQIKAANRWKIADVLIVGRGGGSLEDLLPFSEISVVEAIVSSEIPIISAVGHEIDWALSDFAADLRAPTPSAAAELVCQNQREMIELFHQSLVNIATILRNRIALAKSRTTLFTPQRMQEYFSRRMQQAHLRSDDLHEQMQHAIKMRDRGYAIVSHEGDPPIVSDASTLSEGEHISIRFARGSARATTVSIDTEIQKI